MKKALLLILPVLLLSAAAAAPAQAGPDPAETAFYKAQEAENRGLVEESLPLYKETVERWPGSPFAGEAVFRLGAIYDEKLHNPAQAVAWYTRYVNTVNGRHSRRARIRMETLDRYVDADLAQYQEYVAILNSQETQGQAHAVAAMRAFIEKYPDCPFLDEAMLWLGNEIRGFRRGISDPSEIPKVRESMEWYRRIIREFPGTQTALVAKKNLGDCYRLLNDFAEARKWYLQVLDEGGDFGRVLVGKDLFMAKTDLYRTRIFYGVIAAMVLLFGVMVLLLDLSVKNIISGMWRGVLQSLFFIPVAGVLAAVTFYFTDPEAQNINGSEPWLMIFLAGVTVLALILNAIAMETARRRKFHPIAYAATLTGLLLCLTYTGFFVFDLLPYLEDLAR